MLFSDKFTKKSLHNFLCTDCLLDVKSENIKEKFSFFLVRCDAKNKEKIFSHIPEKLFTEFTDKGKEYLKITKGDLLCYQKEHMANPIRTWCDGDEYNTRLIISLLFQATSEWGEYCTNLYDHGQDHYIHDQRAGSGKAKQFLNWLYSDDGYPGRLEEKNEYEKLIPLCFPNPELLREHFSFLGGQYSLNISDDWEKSILYKTLNDSGLLDEFTIQDKDDQKEIKKAIIAPFCIWQKAIKEVLKQKDLEKQLSLEQQKTHLTSLKGKFDNDKDNSRSTLSESINADKMVIQNASNALRQIRQNIAANKEFFNKFTNDMGVLQAEQYFRALTAHIDSEIAFLDDPKNNLTKKDLDTFLNQTCKEVHSDINELLLAHDFFLADSLEHRDMVINLTRREVKELYKYTSEKIKAYVVEGNKENKSEWLLKQLELNPLFEFFSTKNTGAVDELWKMVESNDVLDNKKDMLDFIDELKEVVNGSSDNKNKVHIELSRWLAFKQWLYNVSYYIPLSSIWLSHINPSKSRTGTKYKGSTLKEKLYTKNKVIPASEFSQSIRKYLSLDTKNKGVVESKHEVNWLIKEFCKKHNISGARERVLTYLGKNKVLWYTLLSVFILLTSAAAIAGRVLSYLGIIPPVAVDRMINSLRGIFDGFVIMFGLDTIIDSIFILAVDFAGIVVRVVDFILLFGLLSTVIRCITKGIGKIVEGISDGFKSVYEAIRVYGLKGSLILLYDKITKNNKEHKAEACAIEKKAEKKKDIMMNEGCDINDISQTIQKLWQESHGKENEHKSNSERMKYVFNNLKSLIETNVICRDVKPSMLFNNFSDNVYNSSKSEFNSSNDWNFIKFQYEFHYLLNKYPEKFSVGIHSNNGNMQYAKRDITVENYRMKMYDVMAAVSLQTKLVPVEEKEGECIKFNKVNNGEKVNLEVLDKKIAAIKWAINSIENYDVDFAIKKAEPVFQTTKTHMSAEIALYDYSKKLEELRKRISEGEQISVNELNAYEMIFSQYIANAHHILSSIDKFTAKNHESSSLHKFREAFDSNVLLKSPSHEAENASFIFGIDRGGVSIFSRMKEYVTDFVSEFQDPRVFATAFAVYYIVIEVPYLIDAAHLITDMPETILSHIGLEVVHYNLTETEIARIFFEMFYERGELLKDVWVLSIVLKDGVIGETEMKKRWSEVKQTIKKTKSHDHHDHGSAKERLTSFINNLVHLILTILCINLIRNLLHKTKTEYHTFSHYEQEKVDSTIELGTDAVVGQSVQQQFQAA